ncbi:MAG: YceI family protein [Bdellovibrionales bacterium]|nr:YceI family protein [Bdellovibrionales bacterium]
MLAGTKSFKAFVLLLSLAAVFAGARAEILSSEESHCVAYKTRKTLFLVRSVDVVGKNCQVSSQVLPELGGRYLIEVRIQAGAFESGESERDRDVVKILKADKFQELIFRTSAWPALQWEQLFRQNSFVLGGELTIAGAAHPVQASVRLIRSGEAVVASGVITTQFKELGIEPPKLGMGILAQVKDNLELHFQLRGDKTLGIDSLLDSNPN